MNSDERAEWHEGYERFVRDRRQREYQESVAKTIRALITERDALRAALKETRKALAQVQTMCKWIPGMESDHYRWTPAQGGRVDDAMKMMESVLARHAALAGGDRDATPAPKKHNTP